MNDTSPLKSLALADLEQELATTRRVLERVPDEQLGWQPHAKSMTLGGLATHIANLVGWQRFMIHDDGMDILAAPPQMKAATSRDELLKAFDANAAALRSALAGADDEALKQTWTLRRGEHVILALPKLVTLRSMGLSHIVHHRGQLTVYLRMLDVPLPPVYGPTADER